VRRPHDPGLEHSATQRPDAWAACGCAFLSAVCCLVSLLCRVLRLCCAVLCVAVIFLPVCVRLSPPFADGGAQQHTAAAVAPHLPERTVSAGRVGEKMSSASAMAQAIAEPKPWTLSRQSPRHTRRALNPSVACALARTGGGTRQGRDMEPQRCPLSRTGACCVLQMARLESPPSR
jgi:hypothetical protein